MRLILPLLALALLALAAPAGRTEEKPSYDVRAAFAQADENGDGVIDRAEFIDRTVEVFYAADANKDGYLSPEELEHGVLNPQDFKHADRNGDGRISLSEFLWARDALFDEADTNGDGVLQLDEVVNIYEKKVKK
ncbi:MAG TPA: EF-hand domain-containing protein [Myxococcota bacterium]|nr:EF-hand domain-containing protein [Myxococcota bacterium]